MSTMPVWVSELLMWFADGEDLLNDELVPLTLGDFHHVRSEEDLRARFCHQGDALYVVGKPMTGYQITYDGIEAEYEDPIVRCTGRGMQAPIMTRWSYLVHLVDNGLLHYAHVQ